MNDYTEEQREKVRLELISSEKKAARRRRIFFISAAVIIPVAIALYILSQQIFIPALLRAKSYRDLQSHDVQVGDILVFGDNMVCNEWRVLAVEGSKIFIVSNECIIGSPGFKQTEYPYDIPDYLNNEYYSYLFSDKERAMICETENGYIFLLSVEEVETYLPNKQDRVTGSRRSNIDSYFLRDFVLASNGEYTNRVYVDQTGEIIAQEYENSRRAIRPAMWLDMDLAAG